MSRVKPIFQLTASECGLACLAMIAAANGRPTTLRRLRQVIEVGRDGVSAHALIEAAPRIGLKAKAISTSAERLGGLPLPAVCLWEHDHFVVVERVGRAGATVIDPSRGRRRLTTAQVADGFRNIVLLFAPSPEGVASSAPVEREPRRTGPLSGEIRKAAGTLVALVVASLLAHLLLLVGPVFVGRVVDRVAADSHGIGTGGLALAAVAVVAMTALVAHFRCRTSITLQRRLDRRLTVGFFRHLVSLPHIELERRGAGDLMARMESLTLARLALTSQVVTTTLDAGLLLVATAAIVMRSPVLGLVAAIGVVVQLVPLILLARPLHESTQRATIGEGAVHGFTAEALQGIATIKALGAEDAAARRFDSLASERLQAEGRRDRLAGWIDTVLATVTAATPLAVLLVGLPAVADHRTSIGALVAVVGLTTAAVAPASSVVSGARAIQAARSHLVRLGDIWEIEAEEGGAPYRLQGAVELRNVGVRYAGSQEWALRGVNLRIRPGSHIGIVGRSGSGKSTLVKVLAGLVSPSEGELSLDGWPSNQLNPQAIRRSIGVVLQDVWLFGGTIEENIVVDRQGIGFDDVRRVAGYAAIDGEIERMPLKYHTKLTDGGGGLSGGQRQRIAIARALATNPRLIVLDEATSNLDSVTETQVATALDRLGVTRISVTHRLSTIRNCDLVIVMDNGRLVQHGPPSLLAGVPGPFQELALSAAS